PQSVGEWLGSARASDSCGPARVMTRLVARVPGCGATWSEQHELWAVDECGNESARVRRTYAVVDRTPPELVAPVDLVVECPAPTGGPDSEAEWLASASATDTCGGARGGGRLVISDAGCGSPFQHV